MISNWVYEIVYKVQLDYSNYYAKNRIPPSVLMMHKSLAAALSNELDENDIGSFMGKVVMIVEDEDLFQDGRYFKWIRISKEND